jgi:hypothetical protein
VKSMETAMEATTSMEMAPEALPRPGRVPEQRLLSPEIGLRWRRRCGTFKTPIDLGFSVGGLYIGGEAASEGHQGAHTIGWRALGVTRAALGCGRHLARLRLSFGLRSSSGKNRSFGFVSSNSENISYVAFLKHKTAENRELALWHLVNRLVPENA